MGMSYTVKAGRIMDQWETSCREQTACQNEYIGKDGARYFIETARTEHRDGHMNGSVWRFMPDGVHITKSGSFRINGDGTVARKPTSWPFANVQPEQTAREVPTISFTASW